MKKSLSYYMSLSYPTEIRRIADEDGGGYMATVPYLGSYAFVGDGDTPDEALRNLEDTKRELFEDYLRDGLEIPEPPEDEDIEAYSGRFVARLPRELHKDLVEAAEASGTSLNQYIIYALTRFRYAGPRRSPRSPRKRKATA